MVTVEEIQKEIIEKVSEIENTYGIDCALWYKIGFMSCIDFIIDLNKQHSKENLNQVFNIKQTSGGIN